MTALPDHLKAAWLPNWRELIDMALTAASEPDRQPVKLKELALRANEWPSPFAQPSGHYLGAALIWTAKAYAQQTSMAGRSQLAEPLKGLALAFHLRLAERAPPAEPIARPDPAPRFRSDIDG